jgi:hypothetical protein
MSVCPSEWKQLDSHWKNFHEISYFRIFRISVEKKFKFHQNPTRITANLYGDVSTFLIVPRPILLRIKNVSEKRFRENHNTKFVHNNFLFRKSYRLWDIVGKYGKARQATDDYIIRRMRNACCITKVRNTHSEYITLISSPQQQRLHERASMLRYTYIARPF